MAKLIECIPNFSVSKEVDPVVFQGLVDVANSVPGCTLLNVQTDGSHNRCVFTMVGSPAGIEEVAFLLTKKATETIDMTKHQGQHPRMGATDVIPFVPTMDVTLDECIELSKRVAQRIWDELKVPSFLYEDSATRPERRNLAKCRKGQFEGMPEKLLEPDWAPDYGERKIHPTAGITAIGADCLQRQPGYRQSGDRQGHCQGHPRFLRWFPVLQGAGHFAGRPQHCPGLHEHGELRRHAPVLCL